MRYDIAYLDDVIIPSMTMMEGLDYLINVFRKTGFTINLRSVISWIHVLSISVSKDHLKVYNRARIVDCNHIFRINK